MIEAELKIMLDAAGEARLRRHPALAELRAAPRKVGSLRSVYYDTAAHDLAAAGIALRLRRVGRSWVQTVKRRRDADGAGGFHAHLEVERPAPGGRLALDGPDPEGVYAEIAAAAGDAALEPVFETRVRRTAERLAAPGGTVELAIDTGEIVAGAARAPIREAELELVTGEIGAIFHLARRLFPSGPVRLGTANKSERGYRLARGEAVSSEASVQRAGALDYPSDATVETVARDVLRDCLGQIAANAAVVAESKNPEGPHQLRVGLRRLRTALSVFGPSLGEPALADASETARALGHVVGRLRDLDVLIDEVVAGAVALGLDDGARDALVAALAERRAATRTEARAVLVGPEATRFLFDLGELIEGRGWLQPADYSQSARLAEPIDAAAPGMLDAVHAKAMKRGGRIETLDSAGLHKLRRSLKRLRYTVETVAPLYQGKRFDAYLGALKQLQDSFGTLNDATMAGEALLGSEAPGADDAAAQRGAGWVLGALAVQANAQRSELFARWKDLEKAKPFWS